MELVLTLTASFPITVNFSRIDVSFSSNHYNLTLLAASTSPTNATTPRAFNDSKNNNSDDDDDPSGSLLLSSDRTVYAPIDFSVGQSRTYRIRFTATTECSPLTPTRLLLSLPIISSSVPSPRLVATPTSASTPTSLTLPPSASPSSPVGNNLTAPSSSPPSPPRELRLGCSIIATRQLKPRSRPPADLVYTDIPIKPSKSPPPPPSTRKSSLPPLEGLSSPTTITASNQPLAPTPTAASGTLRRLPVKRRTVAIVPVRPRAYFVVDHAAPAQV
jgi:hypothetical protein